jgi:hypothetical protein
VKCLQRLPGDPRSTPQPLPWQMGHPVSTIMFECSTCDTGVAGPARPQLISAPERNGSHGRTLSMRRLWLGVKSPAMHLLHRHSQPSQEHMSCSSYQRSARTLCWDGPAPGPHHSGATKPTRQHSWARVYDAGWAQPMAQNILDDADEKKWGQACKWATFLGGKPPTLLCRSRSSRRPAPSACWAGLQTAPARRRLAARTVHA